MSLALVIQHAKGMRQIVSSVARPALQNFSALSHTRRDFREKTLQILGSVFFIFSTSLSEIFLDLRKIKGDTLMNVETSSCKVPFILVRF